MSEQPSTTGESVDTHGTQTHYTDDGPREMLLVGVPVTSVGGENTYPPQNPFEDTVESTMRRTYFIHSGSCIVQLPRRADDFPVTDTKYDLADVCWDSGAIHVYYPISSEEALRITWIYPRDEWEVGKVRFDDYADEIGAKHAQTIWQNRRSL